MPGGQLLSLEGKLGGQTGDKIMKLTAKKQPTKKTSAKIASKINTWLSGVYEGIFADVMIFFSFALLSDAEVLEDIAEYFVGSDLALSGDFCQVGKDEAEVFSNEVTRQLVVKSCDDAAQIVLGME